MKRQFTATAYILKDFKVLLIYHKKLKKWLPPGGHLDPNETPPQAAIREAKEETGLDIRLISQENIWVNYDHAKSFERPYMCLIESIPAYKDEEAHEHMDFIYLAEPIGGEVKHNINEIDDIRWFAIEDVEHLKPNIEIYQETLETVRKILQEFYARV